MRTRSDITNSKVVEHFTARTDKYDDSSKWCTDLTMLAKVFSHLAPSAESVVLDVACGTGLVSKTFQGKVRKLVGVDLTEAMFNKGKVFTDGLVHSSAECLPFKNDAFDLAIERQGIQFMDAAAAVSEMVRATRPNGKICLIQLCAYGEEDQDEYFEILRLRNPARKNFFLREDLATLLKDAGCAEVEVIDYISEENVDRWSDHGAIRDERRAGIRDVYRHASPGFNKYHAVRLEENGTIVDRMLFGIAVGTVSS
ncbi:MAG: class I SAM-dependent methyltransferase [Proteobacteria bacterium]|nr:class I SAM-dependent methyltransferase [Pseudomonadota bacterium]MBU1715985.1 class I SAM-dependent methyltransferase [Pseudomonadota bacterium]